MFTGPSAQALALATAPLVASFGEDLTLWRDGNVVHWSYDDQTVIVTLQFGGTVEAEFFDRPGTDVVNDAEAIAMYRRRSGGAYGLTPAGCKAMVGDMMSFFSGDREPLFDFVGVR